MFTVLTFRRKIIKIRSNTMENKKKALKKLSLSLIFVLLLTVAVMAIAASAEDPILHIGEMVDIENNFSEYLVQDTAKGEDEYVGEYQYTVYYDVEKGEIKAGYHGTPVIIYTVNHPAVDRVGTDSNVEIIDSMLERGYVVVVMDYLNNYDAVGNDLDNSAQLFRRDFAFGYGKMITNEEVFPSGEYRENFLVPSGCNVLLNNVFWEIDKHSANGTFEKIVENWNSDFRAVKGERFIEWTHSDGTRKAVQADFDGNEPVWYDENKKVDPDGTYTYIKYTKAEVITDCVNPDGSFLDMNLYLHLVYPTSPKNEVPVMSLANSGGHPTTAPTSADGALKPQSAYFLYEGYAYAIFDYLWEPMGRNASWGYYDGADGVSGDHMNYSLHIYNDKLVNTAAMRFLRYTSLEDKEGIYNFDLDKFGVYGNSKGGWHNFLGEKAVQSPLVDASKYSTPEELEHAISMALEGLTPDRMYDGHHGETRYSVGAGEVTGDGITLKAGEKQPWLTSGGKEIISGAQITVPENGGSEEDITDGHMPIYVTSNMTDYLHAQYGVTMRIYNVCRELDLPLLHLELPVGHELPTGQDINYNVDSYDIFKRFANYYLKNEAISVAYITPMDNAGNVRVTDKITVAFVGQAELSEVSKITVSANGVAVNGSWERSFGGVVWTFIPDELKGGVEYVLTIPAGFAGSNGTATNEEYKTSFITEFDVSAEPISVSENTYTFTAPTFTTGNSFVFRFNVTNDAANVAELYANSADGELLGETNLRGAGSYEIDITDYVAKNPGNEITLLLKTKNAAESVAVKNESFSGELSSDITPNDGSVTFSYGNEIDGSLALGASVTKVTDYTYSKYYSNPTRILKYSKVLGSDPITKDDLGRLYTFSIDVYDTTDRVFQIRLKHMSDQNTWETIDYDWTFITFRTEANKWTTYTFTHRIYEADYGRISKGTTQYLELMVSPDGDLNSPIYIKDLTVTETVTDIEVSNAVIAEKKVLGGEYEAPLSTVPFAVYNGDTLVGEYDSFVSALAAYVSGYTLKLQSDYTFTDSDVSDSLKSFAEFNFDLGSYTFTCKNTKNSPIWLKATNQNNAQVNITGGVILVGDTPIVSYESATSGGTGKRVAVNFENVSIGFDDRAGCTKIISGTEIPAGIALKSNISFTDCEFNLPDDRRAYDAAILLPASTSAGLDLKYSLNGGSIALTSERWVNVLDNVSAVEFTEDSEGNYTKLILPKSHTYALTGTYRTDKGYSSYSVASENNNMVTYELEIPENATQYGVIPEDKLDGSKHPFLLFKDGSFISAHTSLSSVTSAAITALKDAGDDAEAQILLRANHTATNTGAVAHGASSGTIVFDLNGYTLTRGGNAIAAPELKESTPIYDKTSLVFKNGRVETKSGVMFVTHFLYSTTGVKQYDVLFDNVTIGYAKDATSLKNALWNVWLNDHKASYIETDITFRNCTFDFKTNAPASAPASTETLMALGTQQAQFDVVIEGGKIIGDATNIKFASVDSKDTLTLKPNSDGEYLKLTEGTVAPDISNFVFDDGKYRTFIEDSASGDYILSEGGVSTPYGTITSTYASAQTYPFAIFKYDSTSKKYEFKTAYKTWKSATGGITTYITSSSDQAVILVRRDYDNTNSDYSSDTALNALKGTITFDLGGFTLTRSNTLFSFAMFNASYEANIGNVIIKNGTLLTKKSQIFYSQISVAAEKVFNVKIEDVTLGFAEGATKGENMFWATNLKTGGSSGKMTVNVEFNNCTFDLLSNNPGNTPKLFIFKDTNDIFNHKVSINGGEIICNDLSAVTFYTLNTGSDIITFGADANGEYTKLITNTTAKDKSHHNNAYPMADGNGYFVEISDDGIKSVYELASLKTAYGTASTTAKYLSAVDYPFFVFQNGAFVSAHTNWKTAMAAAKQLVDEASQTELSAQIVMRRDYDIYKATEGSVDFNTAYGTVVLDLGGYTITTVDGYFIDISIKNGTAAYLGYESRFEVKNGTLLNKRATLPSIGFGHSGTSPNGEKKTLSFAFDNVTFKTFEYSVFRDWGHSGATGIDLNFLFNNCVFDFGITKKETIMFYFSSGNKKVVTDVKFAGGQIISDTVANYTLINYNSEDTVVFAKNSEGKYTTLTNPSRYAAPTLEFVSDYGKTLCFTKGTTASNMTVYNLTPKSVITMVPKLSVTLDRDLVYNVYIPQNSDIVRIILNGNEYTDLSALAVEELGGVSFYILKNATAAKYAAESFELEIQIDVGGSVAKGKWTLGIEKYAALIINDADVSDEEKTVVKDVLSYIGAAYTYFECENAADVNTRIDAIIGADYEANNAPAFAGSAEKPATGLSSVSYVLNATPTLRFYLAAGADASTYKFYSDGKALNVKISDDGTYIDLEVYAYVLGKTVTYSIGGVDSGSYHINAYYEYIKTQNNPSLTALVERFARYCESAESYRLSVVNK